MYKMDKKITYIIESLEDIISYCEIDKIKKYINILDNFLIVYDVLHNRINELRTALNRLKHIKKLIESINLLDMYMNLYLENPKIGRENPKTKQYLGQFLINFSDLTE